MASNAARSATKDAAKKERYQVIALKYRPQTFEDLIGQGHIKAALSNAISHDKVAHAFLFAGSRGTGKTTTARILAKALNCLSGDGPTPTPCSNCLACREISDSCDLDVMEIDGASNNGVEQIRELRDSINNKPVRDRYRIIIIDEVHMLSIAAFNALLKTLEEPPAHVKFVFATTDPHKVPETIHSRCQHYDFRRLSTAEIVESLSGIAKTESIRCEQGVIEGIAAVSEGGLRDAQSKLDQLTAFRGDSLKVADLEEVFGLVSRSRVLEMLGQIRRGEKREVLAVVDELFQRGKSLEAFVSGVIRLVRDTMIVKSAGPDFQGLDLLPDEQAKIAEEAKEWEHDSLVYAIDYLNDLSRRLKGADFPRIILEAALIKICEIDSLRPVRDIVATLDAMLKGKVPLATGASPKKA